MHEPLSDTNNGSFLHVFAQCESIRREDDNRRSVLEPAHFFAFAEAGNAWNDVRPAVAGIELNFEEAKPDAGDENCRDWHQRDEGTSGQPGSNHGAFVLAEKFLDPFERNGIHIPRVPGDVGYLLDTAVVGGVETVVHARRVT